MKTPLRNSAVQHNAPTPGGGIHQRLGTARRRLPAGNTPTTTTSRDHSDIATLHSPSTVDADFVTRRARRPRRSRSPSTRDIEAPRFTMHARFVSRSLSRIISFRTDSVFLRQDAQSMAQSLPARRRPCRRQQRERNLYTLLGGKRAAGDSSALPRLRLASSPFTLHEHVRGRLGQLLRQPRLRIADVRVRRRLRGLRPALAPAATGLQPTTPPRVNTSGTPCPLHQHCHSHRNAR